MYLYSVLMFTLCTIWQKKIYLIPPWILITNFNLNTNLFVLPSLSFHFFRLPWLYVVQVLYFKLVFYSLFTHWYSILQIWIVLQLHNSWEGGWRRRRGLYNYIFDVKLWKSVHYQFILNFPFGWVLKLFYVFDVYIYLELSSLN